MKRLIAIITLAMAVVCRADETIAVEPAKLSTAEAEGLFAAKVLPLFKEKCFACHGATPKKVKGG